MGEEAVEFMPYKKNQLRLIRGGRNGRIYALQKESTMSYTRMREKRIFMLFKKNNFFIYSWDGE